MGNKKIGHGTWIDKLASEMMEREKELNRNIDDTIWVESGLGASGIPHIGSIGDAVRAYGVKLALNSMGYKSELLAYADDMDGLRKIPAGLNEKQSKMLENEIGKPVSLIPDPFGEHESYGYHMGHILRDGLDSLGIDYTFQRAFDTYEKGLLAEQSHQILSNYEKVGITIYEITGQEKYMRTLPYFAICENCGNLYTTDSYSYDPKTRRVSYNCKDATIGGNDINGCGYSGEARINRNEGKLSWKVEFAARWNVFDIRFEAYGKDIMDSVFVNDKIASDILGTPPPHHARYEMFLDKGGKKISKSAGNVLKVQDWLMVCPPHIILMLLYKRIGGARSLNIEDVPALMREYNEIENIYFGKTIPQNRDTIPKLSGLYMYANLLNPPKEIPTQINYKLAIEMAKMYPENTVQNIMRGLVKYGAISDVNDMHASNIARLAYAFAEKYENEKNIEKIAITENEGKALDALIERFYSASNDDDPGKLVFESATQFGVKPRKFFPILYSIIIGTNRGPKLGPLITDMGMRRVAGILQNNKTSLIIEEL